MINRRKKPKVVVVLPDLIKIRDRQRGHALAHLDGERGDRHIFVASVVECGIAALGGVDVIAQKIPDLLRKRVGFGVIVLPGIKIYHLALRVDRKGDHGILEPIDVLCHRPRFRLGEGRLAVIIHKARTADLGGHPEILGVEVAVQIDSARVCLPGSEVVVERVARKARRLVLFVDLKYFSAKLGRPYSFKSEL